MNIVGKLSGKEKFLTFEGRETQFTHAHWPCFYFSQNIKRIFETKNEL